MGNELMPVSKMKGLLERVDVKKRFEGMLGKKAPQFMASVVNVVAGSYQLQKCDPTSILSAAFVAASFDLPIDQNLGFAAIVPYAGKAQFQMMYRGFIQLAIRTGQYRGMNASEVYEDEIVSSNPITKEVKFVDKFNIDSQRSRGEKDKIAGYYAWFELVNGFKQQLYMTTDEIKQHATTYSASYKNDLREKKSLSKWSTDFDPMAIKTVIKLLLSKWGILSIDMQKAIIQDQSVYEDGQPSYADNPDTIDTQLSDPFSQKEDVAERQPGEDG